MCGILGRWGLGSVVRGSNSKCGIEKQGWKEMLKSKSLETSFIMYLSSSYCNIDL